MHCSFFLLLCAALFALSSTALPSKPNILVILADDQGIGDIGYTVSSAYQPGAGGKRYTPNPPRTPFLDALASDDASLVFDRFYSGSPVCSPTRASLLSGRTPDRECVFNAEGCGQEPAWSCINPQPFPGGYSSGVGVYTLADAASSAGYATLHSGKWHLGNFFPKANPDPSDAYSKWPTMHPGMCGFSAWYSTEASASSTMCNCGCEAAWPLQAPGCLLGGGAFVLNRSFPCTNYWGPSPAAPPGPACASPTAATLACVANATTKIPGDDTLFQLQRLREFVAGAAAAAQPFLATLQLHTNHIPHPALPQYFFAYNGTDGRPAGDYLGTLTQMDAGLGQVLAMLRDTGVAGNTLIWYSADNGCHPGTVNDGAGGIPVKNTATLGLRQCKASVFEGGIRVPGLVHWPGVITGNPHTATPAYTPDLLPTVLQLLGLAHPRPHWASDGASLLPLLTGNASWARPRYLAWRLGSQVAVLEPAGRYKYVLAPEAGQCAADAANYSYATPGGLLFDLLADPTESAPLSAAHPQHAALAAAALQWQASIAVSQVNESGCLPPGPTPAPLRHTPTGTCLAVTQVALHAPLRVDAPCSPVEEKNTWSVQGGRGLVLRGGGGGQRARGALVLSPRLWPVRQGQHSVAGQQLHCQ